MSIKKMFRGEASKNAHRGRITGSGGHNLKASCISNELRSFFRTFQVISTKKALTELPKADR